MIINNKFYLNKGFDNISLLMPMYEKKLQDEDPLDVIEDEYSEKIKWLKEYRKTTRMDMDSFISKKKELDKEKKRRLISLKFLSEASEIDILTRLADAREFVDEPTSELGRFTYYYYDPFVRQMVENSFSSSYRRVFNSLCYEFDQAISNLKYRQKSKPAETFEEFVFIKKRHQMVDEKVKK